MHRDLKLGLALAVLLVGSTTAFFFRSEADPDTGLPKLNDPASLDGIIAEREITPYLGTPDLEPHETVSDWATGGETDSPWAKPAFLGGSTAVARSDTFMPDPIQILADDDAKQFEPLRAYARELTFEEPRSDENEPALHVVEAGDTLSALAGRYLGSIARFDEIYELNRDTLQGPHDLTIGMKLRLPSIEPAVSSSPGESIALPTSDTGVANDATTAADAANDGPETVSTATDAETKRFVPARKTPFVPARYHGSDATADAG